jgi:hypothetical protein
VNVAPSVVTVVGVVRPVGTVNVSDPMMIIPDLEVIVWPLGRVEITTAGVELVIVETIGLVGESIKVSPSVTSVVGEVTVGRVILLEPITMIPELEVIVWPSGRVVMRTDGAEVALAMGELKGESVKVSPSVTSVVGEVTVGRVILLEPITMIPELEVIVWPSGRVVTRTDGAELVLAKEELRGESVKVSPSVTSVVSEVTIGRVIVWPSGRIVVSRPKPVLVVDGGKSVKVSPSVVSKLWDETVGRVTVLVPMIRIPELEITV